MEKDCELNQRQVWFCDLLLQAISVDQQFQMINIVLDR